MSINELPANSFDYLSIYRCNMKKIIFLLCYLLLFYCCKRTDKNNIILLSDTNSNIVYDSICSLKENIDILGNINSFNFIDSNHFIISTISPDPALFIYNSQGIQEKKINRLGRGPGEYIEPAIVHVFNNHIYIWCSKQLKLIKLDLKGRFIEEYKNFKKAIKDFSIWNENLIFYIAGGFNEALLEIHHIHQRNNIDYIGKPSNEHLVLNLTERSGGLILVNDSLYYTSADALHIYCTNIKNTTHNTSSYFKDTEFIVNKLNLDANILVNNERDKVIDYLLSNSIITNLFYANNYLIIQSEVGKSKIIDKRIDHSQRYLKYYIFDSGKNYLYSVKELYNPNYNIQRYANYDNKLYNIKTSLRNEDLTYVVSEISFSKTNL